VQRLHTVVDNLRYSSRSCPLDPSQA
jgi:hypothetical protein